MFLVILALIPLYHSEYADVSFLVHSKNTWRADGGAYVSIVSSTRVHGRMASRWAEDRVGAERCLV
jgi:hypothetical protein